MKISLRILTGLTCAWLLIVGIVNLVMRYPQHLDLSKLSFTSIYLIPKITYIIYIILSLFVLIKLFLYKQTLIHKIVSVVLALSGFMQITVIVVYYYNLRNYFMISSSVISSYQNYLLIAGHVSNIMIALLMILICINTFKTFIKNRTAFIISLCAFAFKTVIYLIPTFTLTNFFAVNVRYLINTIIIIVSSILINTSCFWGSYIGLKTNTKQPILQNKLKP